MHCEPIADCHTVATFAALKEVIAACAVFVGIDGGPKHLAIAAGTPSVSLYHRAHKAVIWNPPETRAIASSPPGPACPAIS